MSTELSFGILLNIVEQIGSTATRYKVYASLMELLLSIHEPNAKTRDHWLLLLATKGIDQLYTAGTLASWSRESLCQRH